MEMLEHAISWAEIPVIEFQRAKTFYQKIFAFEMPEMQMGPNRMGILLHNQEGGGIGAAIIEGPDYVPAEKGIRIYLNAGKNLDTVLGRVTAAGGIVKISKTAVAPGMGFIASFEDTEGNHLFLHSSE